MKAIKDFLFFFSFSSCSWFVRCEKFADYKHKMSLKWISLMKNELIYCCCDVKSWIVECIYFQFPPNKHEYTLSIVMNAILPENCTKIKRKRHDSWFSVFFYFFSSSGVFQIHLDDMTIQWLMNVLKKKIMHVYFEKNHEKHPILYTRAQNKKKTRQIVYHRFWMGNHVTKQNDKFL